MSREDDEKEIEATKAPLMEHLVELRSRLIKAILAFAIMFIICFFFAKQIYNVLVLPYVWAAGLRGEVPTMIYTAPQEYFLVQVKVALFGALFITVLALLGFRGLAALERRFSKWRPRVGSAG